MGLSLSQSRAGAVGTLLRVIPDLHSSQEQLSLERAAGKGRGEMI